MSVIICRGPALEEVSRRDLGARWCFSCRKRQNFVYVVIAPTEPSYYDPLPSIRCSGCNRADADLGFGRCREWD